MHRKAVVAIVGELLLIVLATGLFLAAFNQAQPDFKNAEYRMERAKAWQSFTPPLTFNSGRTFVDVRITMVLSALHTSTYRFIADDCIHEIRVNGHHIQYEDLPVCDYVHGTSISLAPHLHAGTNQINILMLNKGGPGSLDIRPQLRDPQLFTVLLLYLGTLTLCLGGIWMACRKTPWCWWTIFLGTIGTLLRLLYVLNTSHTERAHDVGGHLEYIRYIASHLALPPLKEGWETFHPPLYYMASAVWYRLGMMLGRAESLLLRDLQWGSLLASIAVALIGIWIGWLLFPEHKQRSSAVIFGSVVAVFPGLIYFAARINNDVFVHIWLFLAMALTLFWWKNSKIRWWYLAILVTGLGMLSKGNALLFVPVLFGTLIFKSRLRWRRKLLHIIGGVLLLGIVTSWFFGLRLAQGQSHIVENVSSLNSRLAVESTAELFTEFNPLRMLIHPYNDPWHDEGGRQHFFEYLFRSAFFGEFDFGESLRPLSTFLLLLALILCIPMIVGFWIAVRRHMRASSPLWLTLICFTSGHIALRIISPYSPSQDFRYSFLLLVPCTAFILQGISAMPNGWRRFYRTILLILITVCAVFMVLVATR